MASALGTRAPCCCLQPAAARAHALAPGISFAPCSSTPFSAASTRPCSTSGIRPRPHPPRTICAAGAPPPGAQFAPAFGLLSASSALLAVAALVAPEALLKPAFGAGNYSALALPYLSLAGGSLTLSCAVEFCLKDAAENGRLLSATYQRLMAGCAAKSLAYIAVLLATPEAASRLVTAIYLPAASASLAINVAALVATRSGGSQPASMKLPLAPSTAAGWGYMLLVLMYLVIAAASCLTPPGAPGLFAAAASIGEGPAELLLRRTWAPGLLLAAVAGLNLRDAADRSRLGASTFKRLNLGLVAHEAAFVAVFGSAMLQGLAAADASGLGNLAVACAAGLFAGWQWLSAKK